MTAPTAGGPSPRWRTRVGPPCRRRYRPSTRTATPISREFARGGSGASSRRTIGGWGRRVAIKELLPGGVGRRSVLFGEARITARLQHPGIVPVHDLGRWPDGEPFFAMKLVEGRPLSEVIAGTRTLDERLALLPHALAVAGALAYAHREGFVHRDLKPANVLVGAFGETVVIDWGPRARSIRWGASSSPRRRPRPRTSPRSRWPAPCSAPPATCPPSRRTARRSTSAPTSTRSARCSITCSPASPPHGRKASPTSSWPRCGVGLPSASSGRRRGCRASSSPSSARPWRGRRRSGIRRRASSQTTSAGS